MNSFGRIDTTFDEGDGSDNGRTRKRDSLFLSARLTIAPGPTVHDVRVRNLSEGGLMAEYEQPVAAGTGVTLEMRGVGELTGRIAWCTDGRIGIAFDQPIDPSRARKPVGRGAGTPSYARPLVVTARRR